MIYYSPKDDEEENAPIVDLCANTATSSYDPIVILDDLAREWTELDSGLMYEGFGDVRLIVDEPSSSDGTSYLAWFNVGIDSISIQITFCESVDPTPQEYYDNHLLEIFNSVFQKALADSSSLSASGSSFMPDEQVIDDQYTPLLISDDFVEYSSLDDELYGKWVWEDYKTAFTLKYPQEWEKSFASDSGAAIFLMAAENLEAVWSAQDHNIPNIIFFFEALDFCDQEDLEGDPTITLLSNCIVFFKEEGNEIIEEPNEIKINGHTAARAILKNSEDGNITIVTMIIEGNADLLIFASSPIEKDLEYRPILEAIIGTIKLESTE